MFLKFIRDRRIYTIRSIVRIRLIGSILRNRGHDLQNAKHHDKRAFAVYYNPAFVQDSERGRIAVYYNPRLCMIRREAVSLRDLL